MAVRSRANQPCVDGFLFVGLSSWCLKTQSGRAYTRPVTGTAKSLQKDAFNTPRIGACVERLPFESSKFSGFVTDSSRSYAKLYFRKCVGLCEAGGLVLGKRWEGSRRVPAEARMDARWRAPGHSAGQHQGKARKEEEVTRSRGCKSAG